jgi:hypothetical protein
MGWLRERNAVSLTFADDSYDPSWKVQVFGGFRTSAQLSLQVGLLAHTYAVPALVSIAPFGHLIVDSYFSWLSSHLVEFGYRAFPEGHVWANDQIHNVTMQGMLLPQDQFIMTGINVGGVIARDAALEDHRSAISFWDLPVYMESLGYRELPSGLDRMMTITNEPSIFTAPERGVTNVPIPAIRPPGAFPDSVHAGVCTLAELCLRRSQLGVFCDSVLGDSYLFIRQVLIQRGYIEV